MATTDVLREILDWSSDRPQWQRDALRRLVSNGELKEADVREIAELCKTSHGLADKAKSEPLAATHLPQPDAANLPISLTTLTHHSGVNALAQDQTIEFGAALTVVFGANAAGKSGYTRILKRACRARGAEEILGNVVTETTPGRPSATVEYKIGDATRPPYQWDDENPPHTDLSRVSVFDRHCASVYVAEQTDVAYRPLGLDLFDKLADACESVRRVLEKERNDLKAQRLHLPEVADGTKVHELLSRLTSLTDPEAVRQLASISDEERGHLQELHKRLRDLNTDDPQKTARTLEIRAKRFELLAEKGRAITGLLSDQAAADLVAASDRVNDARRAANELRRATFQQQPLPNTGTDTWRALWAAAEQFSTTDAYPEQTFPVIEPSARCVLCQQILGDDAVERFRRFHDFLLSQVQRDEDAATTAYEHLWTQIRDLPSVDDATSEALDELRLEDPEIADAVSVLFEGAQHRRVALLNALAEATPTAATLPPLASNVEPLTVRVDALRKRATELRGADRSATIKQLETEIRELEARRLLAKHVDVALAEIERKKRVAAYQLCLDETKTTAITRKSSQVTKRAVTEQLAKSFKEELGALQFRLVEVEMVAAGGARGALYHRLQLRRAPGVSVPKVVSEGESRCLSIASFFAELSTAADRSAILFDDPVSSLDHTWRDSVAARLVDESRVRQVVVFTHDIVFLVSLIEHADKIGVDVRHQNLRRGFTASGLSEQGLPFQGMKVSDRLGYLRSQLQRARKMYKENKPREYEEAGRHIYGHLRQAWERAVEEVLLNEVVLRYRKSVETQRARRLGDITENDCKGLDDGMTKCSKWEGGHDHAAAEGAQFPDPTEIEASIKALDEWVKVIRKRRRS